MIECLKKESIEVNINCFAFLKMTSNSDSDTPVTPKKTKISKPKLLQKYKPEWEKQYEWIKSDPQNKNGARCILCTVNFTIGSAGIGQVNELFNIHLCVMCYPENFF